MKSNRRKAIRLVVKEANPGRQSIGGQPQRDGHERLAEDLTIRAGRGIGDPHAMPEQEPPLVELDWGLR